MQKSILVLSVTVNLFFVIMFAIIIPPRGGISYLTYKLGFNSSFGVAKLNPTLETDVYDQRESLFKILPKESNEIIFIGNSITYRCEWSELFRNPKIKNRGINSDIISGVLLRIDKILESKPKKIFILIGINDLSANFQIQLCVDNYQKIISKIRTASPLTRIYIQSLLPINNKFYRGYATNEKIRILNSGLQNLANDKQITYVDLFSHFINSEGSMDEKYSNDGLHLLGSGYLVWKSVIEKYVH